MTTLTWKRKKPCQPTQTSKTASAFNEEEEQDEEEFLGDWRTLIPSNKKVMLEDSITKSNRLQQEAVALAEQDRFWEAIKKFDEALEYTPTEAKVHEMKAQALLEVGEIFPAIQAAEKAVEISPLWAAAYQTLGRAQMGKGEIKLALRNFCKAYHLQPDLEELFTEDICWAQELLEKQKSLKEVSGGCSENPNYCIKCGKETEQSTEVVEKSAEDHSKT